MEKFCCLRKVHLRADDDNGGAAEDSNDQDNGCEGEGDESGDGDQDSAQESAASDKLEGSMRREVKAIVPDEKESSKREEEKKSRDACDHSLNPMISIHSLVGTERSQRIITASRKEGVLFSCGSGELKDHLLHDATEHYLFIREVMAACGHIWSVGLTGLFALAIYIIIAYSTFSVYFYKLDSGVTIWQLIIVMIVRTLLLIIYPIASVCHANTYIYELQETFSVAAPDDFSVLGGRDRWVALLQQSPAVWTYYGLWITYDRLLGLAWTMVAALVAYVFSVLFRS